ncbi:MAG: LON peptidase substrate-binding domain-containing protein, partial [Chloroflexota bacterium]
MTDHDWFAHGEGDISPQEIQERAAELEAIPDLIPDKEGLIEVPVLSLRDLIVFPHMTAPLSIGRRRTHLAIDEAHANHSIMLALPQRDPRKRNPLPQDYLSVGVEVAVSDIMNTADDQEAVLVQGRRRVEIIDFLTGGPVLYARGRVVEETEKLNAE